MEVISIQENYFCESGMEVISIQENYFCESNFAEFLQIQKFSEPCSPPFSIPIPTLYLSKQNVSY